MAAYLADGTTCGFVDSLPIAFAKAPIALTILLPRLGQCDQKGSKMIWAQLLAYVTGTVDQELLLRNEYLAAENRILKAQIKGRLLLSEEEKATLAEIAHRLGRKALKEVAGAAQPDTILGWYRSLIAKKFDGSRFRQRGGRPRIAGEIERLVVRMANENPSWGYDRIVGALANLGHRLSDQTVGNILRRHGLSPAPKRKQTVSWKDFIRSHRDVLVGMDFFTAEVLTLKARILSRTDRIGKREGASLASKKPESELVRRTLGEVGQRRMSVEADPGWRIVAAASLAAIHRPLPRRAEPSRQRQSDLVSFADEGKKERGSSAVPGTTGRPAEVLRAGSGIKVDGTAGDGPTMSTYRKDAGNLPWKKTSRASFIIDGR